MKLSIRASRSTVTASVGMSILNMAGLSVISQDTAINKMIRPFPERTGHQYFGKNVNARFKGKGRSGASVSQPERLAQGGSGR